MATEGVESAEGVEVCSCDEALALRAEVARLTAALAATERESNGNYNAWKAAEARVRELEDIFSYITSEHDRLAAAEARIERARKILAEGRPVDSAESRLASDLREVLGGE